MKKLVYILGISSIMVFFTSCFKEKDNWYTNTFKYDGRFSVAQKCDLRGEFTDVLFTDEYFSEQEDKEKGIKGDYALDYRDVNIEDGAELMIYNSAANVEDEIIVDAHIAGNFYIKGKFKITGDQANFKGTGVVNNLSSASGLTDYEYWLLWDGVIDDWTHIFLQYLNPAPDKDGGEYEFLQLYTRFSLDEASITPADQLDKANTIGGNKSDAITVKITAYHDYLIVESYTIPEEDWKNPAKPEYAWRIKAGSRKNAAGEEEKWTLKGYRYTGYPEDNPDIQPPIIDKDKF